MNRRPIAIIIIAVLTIGATIATANGVRQQGAYTVQPGAQPPVGAGPMYMSGMWDRLVKELNLTSTQQAQIMVIRQNFMTVTQADRDELRTKMQQMKQLWAVDNPDPAAVKSLARDINEIHSRMIDPGVDAMIAGWNVLDSNQKAKLRTMIQQHMGRYGMYMGMP